MRKIFFFSIFLLAALCIAALLLVGLWNSQNSYPNNVLSENGPPNPDSVSASNCFVVEEHEVRGSSLSGIIENGEKILLLRGYYACHKIERKDIVAYDFAGNENLIIKIVKALPGDSFSLKKKEDLSGWNIIINDEIVVNSDNQPYVLDDKKHKMLSLYEESYKGIIPEDSYLILGNIPHGTIDSTLFGLVNKNDIRGKVEI